MKPADALKFFQYKYRIRLKFLELFGNEQGQSIAKRDLFSKYKINPFTFKKDISILMGETETIAEERLTIYAKFLNCTTEYLEADYMAFKKRLGI